MALLSIINQAARRQLMTARRRFFALAIARHVHSHLSQWVRRAQVVSVADTPTGAKWGKTGGVIVSTLLTARAHDSSMKNAQEGAMSKKGKPLVHSQMLTFRCSPEERIELSKLAHRRRQSVSYTLRALIAQATAAQRTNKSAASGAAPTNAPAAK